MTKDTSTYYAWIGGSCDYGHKERAGGAAVVIEQGGKVVYRDVIADFHTTEFRMMLTLMVKVMNALPNGADILFLTNVAYIQNFDKAPTSKSANPDLISQCIKAKRLHNSVTVKIVQYHKSPLLIKTHDTSTEAMKKLRKELAEQRKQSGTCSQTLLGTLANNKNYAESQRKKTENRNYKHNMNEGMFKTILFIISFGMMLMSGCSSKNNKANTTTYQEQTSDSTTKELQPMSPEATDMVEEGTHIGQPSTLDKLAKDMVYVEGDPESFYICKYEVTQKLWKEVMGDNPSEMQGDDLPVEQINWNDCQTFINKLNMLTGKKYRLPTEAEWEYACKGGKYSKGYKYSGSNDIDEVAWYDANSNGKTHPVGQKKANELGLYDMSGNVWEWCQDMHEYTGMCRGGSWIHNARNSDPSLPNETPQAFKINCLGLRLAL